MTDALRDSTTRLRLAAKVDLSGDTFSGRTVGNGHVPVDAYDGWGTASGGDVWSNDGGAFQSWSGVSGGYGRLRCANSSNTNGYFSLPGLVVNGGARIRFKAPGSSININAIVGFAFRGGWWYARLVGSPLRLEVHSPTNNYYYSYTWVAGTSYWFAAEVVDSTIRAKVWQDGNSEPDWQAVLNDPAGGHLTAAAIQLRMTPRPPTEVYPSSDDWVYDSFSRYEYQGASPQIRDSTPVRFRLKAESTRDVSARYKIANATLVDVPTRFRARARSLRDASSRFWIGLTFAFGRTRFRLVVTRDSKTRFRTAVSRDGNTRFLLPGSTHQDAAVRLQFGVRAAPTSKLCSFKYLDADGSFIGMLHGVINEPIFSSKLNQGFAALHIDLDHYPTELGFGNLIEVDFPDGSIAGIWKVEQRAEENKENPQTYSMDLVPLAAEASEVDFEANYTLDATQDGTPLGEVDPAVWTTAAVPRAMHLSLGRIKWLGGATAMGKSWSFNSPGDVLEFIPQEYYHVGQYTDDSYQGDERGGAGGTSLQIWNDYPIEDIDPYTGDPLQSCVAYWPVKTGTHAFADQYNPDAYYGMSAGDGTRGFTVVPGQVIHIDWWGKCGYIEEWVRVNRQGAYLELYDADGVYLGSDGLAGSDPVTGLPIEVMGFWVQWSGDYVVPDTIGSGAPAYAVLVLGLPAVKEVPTVFHLLDEVHFSVIGGGTSGAYIARYAYVFNNGRIKDALDQHVHYGGACWWWMIHETGVVDVTDEPDYPHVVTLGREVTETTFDENITNLINVQKVVGATPSGGTKALTQTAIDDNPLNPYSVPAIGRRVGQPYTDTSLVTQAMVDAMAVSLLSQQEKVTRLRSAHIVGYNKHRIRCGDSMKIRMPGADQSQGGYSPMGPYVVQEVVQYGATDVYDVILSDCTSKFEMVAGVSRDHSIDKLIQNQQRTLPVSPDGTSGAGTIGSRFTTVGDMLFQNASAIADRLPIGSVGQILSVVGGLPAWVTKAILSAITSKGDVIAGNASGTPTRLPVGADGKVLTARSTATLGVDWEDPTGGGGGMTNPMTTKGDIIYENGTPAADRLPLDTHDGWVLTVNDTTGLPEWRAPSGGFSNPMTTQGDIIFENATPAPTRLPVGSSGDVLTVVSGQPAWAAPSEGGGGGVNFDNNSAMAKLGTSTSNWPSNTWQDLTYDTVIRDSGSNFNTSNGRFTAPVAGWYNIWLLVRWNNAGTGTYVALGLKLNGTQILESGTEFGSQYSESAASWTIYLGAGDYVIPMAYANPAGFSILADAPASGQYTRAGFVLVGGGSGAATSDHFVTTVSDSDLSANIVIPGLAGSPDKKVGGTNDDEFEQNASGTPSGWTTFGTGLTVDTNSAKSHLRLQRDATSSGVPAGIYKALPGGVTTVTCKLSDAALRDSYNKAGLAIFPGSVGSVAYFVLMVQQAGPIGIAVNKQNADNTYNGATLGGIGQANYLVPPLYFRCVINSSSSVDAYYSLNGLVWNKLGNFNPGGTIANVGLFCAAENATYLGDASFDWIRFS